MFCKHCGGKLAENGHAFCPHCGKQGALHEEKSRLPGWFKWLSGGLLVIFSFLILTYILSPDLSDTVVQELQALKSNRITEAYYNYTSKEFRESVSLEHFRQFVQAYPFLTNQKSVALLDQKVEGNSGVLKAAITSNTGEERVIDFRLHREEEAWKISGIALEIKNPQEIAAGDLQSPSSQMEPFDASPIYHAILEQMEKIRKNELAEAYYRYTGKEFKETTSYTAFEKFIRSHDGFKDNTALDLNHLSFDNNIAEVKGRLISKEGKIYPVEYNLAYEEPFWKINYIHIIPKAVEYEEVEGPITLRL